MQMPFGCNGNIMLPPRLRGCGRGRGRGRGWGWGGAAPSNGSHLPSIECNIPYSMLFRIDEELPHEREIARITPKCSHNYRRISKIRKWAFPKKQLWILFHAYAVTHRLKKAMRNNMGYGILRKQAHSCQSWGSPHILNDLKCSMYSLKAANWKQRHMHAPHAPGGESKWVQCGAYKTVPETMVLFQ